MITYLGKEVRIMAGYKGDKLATIRLADGRMRVVGVHQLKGTRGGVMEVMVVWQEACRRAEALEGKV